MAATYDPSGHALLSTAAAALSGTDLTAYAEAAEHLLGIHGTGYTGDDAEALTLAVVFQVNLMVAMPDEFSFVESERKGDQSFAYRDLNEIEIDARAERLVRSVVGEDPERRAPPSAAATAEFHHEYPVNE